MNESATSTLLADSTDSLSSSRLLASGSSDAKRGASQISRSYKQSSNFFLQRRFPEALLTIQPLITSQKRKGHSIQDSEVSCQAPIAIASRSNRVKVWSLYLTLLNAIVELGSEDGKNLFGNAVWKGILSRIRDATIWEEVVQVGYSGSEGSVDAEVVSNLATLLITHSPTQRPTQQRLEAYLSASSYSSFDISSYLESSVENGSSDQKSRGSGTDTPRDLGSKVKVIELYALHVLPRNEEWEYAREFITMSEFLDEDVREDFLQILQSLEDQKLADHQREEEILREREEEAQRAEAQRQSQQAKASSNAKQIHSEQDYGIEEPTPARRTRSSTSGRSSKSLAAPKSSQSRKASNISYPGMVYNKSVAYLAVLPRFAIHMAQSLSHSPAALLRLLVFLLALMVALGRRDARELLLRLTSIGWNRLRRTVGMGIKVSYI